jgi:hypothetical protein
MPVTIATENRIGLRPVQAKKLVRPYLKNKQGIVTYTYDLSYLRGKGRRIIQASAGQKEIRGRGRSYLKYN